MTNFSEDEMLRQLQPIFVEVLDQPGLVVTRKSNALNTKNWDSMSHIELVEVIERRFQVRFALEELQDLKDVGDLVDLLVSRTTRS